MDIKHVKFVIAAPLHAKVKAAAYTAGISVLEAYKRLIFSAVAVASFTEISEKLQALEKPYTIYLRKLREEYQGGPDNYGR